MSQLTAMVMGGQSVHLTTLFPGQAYCLDSVNVYIYVHKEIKFKYCLNQFH